MRMKDQTKIMRMKDHTKIMRLMRPYVARVEKHMRRMISGFVSTSGSMENVWMSLLQGTITWNISCAPHETMRELDPTTHLRNVGQYILTNPATPPSRTKFLSCFGVSWFVKKYWPTFLRYVVVARSLSQHEGHMKCFMSSALVGANFIHFSWNHL